jgi:hypothetical protein
MNTKTTENTENTEIAAPTALPPEVQALIDAAAQQVSNKEQIGIPTISLRGKKFVMNEEKIGFRDEKLGLCLDVVILATVYEHAYYDRPFNPDEVTPPACFSIGQDLPSMVHHESTPVPQWENCESCPKNQFKSSANGKGKACRNGRRLLVAPIDENGVDLEQLAIINLSPTALRTFSAYAKKLASIKRLPLWAVNTRVSFDLDTDFPSVICSYNGNVNDADIIDITQRLEEFLDSVSQPLDVSGYIPLGTEPAKKSKMS